jgi:hypothetical protein
LPFASTERLTMTMVTAVPGERRATSTPPIARTVTSSSASPLSGSISTDAHVSTARGAGGKKRRGRRSVIVAVAALGLGIAGGGIALTRTSSAPHAAIETSLPPQQFAPRILEPASPMVRVTVPVHPPTARVTIGGIVRTLKDGMLALEGKPGESFVVVLEHQGARHEIPVAITSDGRAVPYAIEAPSAPAATASPLASSPAKNARPSPAPVPTGANVIASAAPQASTAAPAPSASSLPELKKSW